MSQFAFCVFLMLNWYTILLFQAVHIQLHNSFYIQIDSKLGFWLGLSVSTSQINWIFCAKILMIPNFLVLYLFYLQRSFKLYNSTKYTAKWSLSEQNIKFWISILWCKCLNCLGKWVVIRMMMIERNKYEIST